MNRTHCLRLVAAPLALLGLAGTANAQLVFQQVAGTPSGGTLNGSSENVDFADVDLDGDWDAAFADGGDDGNDQNRIWINNGTGGFSDETNARFPSQADDSRDVEFADIDNDGDADLYISNTAQIVNQGNKWWVNTGVGDGVYVDETSTRWVNLGGPGSSISPAGILPSGTFIDWTCDCDFGDLDNDGDLDLVHSTYGGAFQGNVPTRIFLNDGTGKFEEFNPSGIQLVGPTISNGQPAIWAEGVQQANTQNSTGQQADIATNTLDIDVGDIDGDFDLDILHGARDQDPRMFQNRLEENGGTLGFRDVTSATFPAGYIVNGGNYEQEMGDMDGDGDLDIYGLNWAGAAGSDRTFRNNGNGVYTILQNQLPGSGADDNEGDFLDYDNDGDLDLFVANFSGTDKLYNNNGTGTLTSVSGEGTSGGSPSLDADAADLDGDGDYDVIVAEDNFAPNKFLRNITNIPDTHAPYIPNVEDPGPQTAGTAAVPVRAQVYDNTPYYITWYNPTQVNMTVDGYDIGSVGARTSQGNIFRAEVPGNLVGVVDLEWQSEDEYGNTGTSSTVSYAGTTGLGFTADFGPSTNSTVTGVAPEVDILSVPFAGTTLYYGIQGASSTAYLLATASDQIVGGLPLPGLLLANITGTVYSQVSGVLDSAGQKTFAVPLATTLTSGVTVYLQGFTFEGATNGDLLVSSRGVSLTTQ